MKTNAAVLILLTLLVLILGPLVALWSINTLFPAAAIPYNLETWTATVVLMALVRGNPTNKTS
jgi:hypothetical protein